MTGDKAKDQAAITDLLKQKVGGAAEAMGKTASGKAAILSNQFGELQEKVGSKLVPALTRLADIGLKVVDFISRNSSVILPLVAVVGTLIAGIKIWTMAQAALNVVMAMNPIGLVVVAIAALVAGLVLAYRHSETFRNIVNGAFHAVGSAASSMWDGMIRPAFKFIADAWFMVVGALVNGAAKAFGWVPGIGDKLKGAAKEFNKFRDKVNAALDGVRDRKITVTATLLKQGFGSNAAQQLGRDSDIAGKRAAGGPVLSGKTYLVGENGPELFTASGNGTIIPNGGTRSGGGGSGGGVQTVRVELTLGGRVIHTELLRLKRELGGSLGLA
jgi:hypothetical protein